MTVQNEDRHPFEVDMIFFCATEHQLTTEEVIQRFGALDSAKQVRVLGAVSYQFTLAGRDVSLSGDCQLQRDRLYAINELQHKLIAQMMAVFDERAERYPDPVFFQILAEISQNSGLVAYLERAYSKALE